MITEIRSDLIKVSTYASRIGKSSTWVYRLAKEKKIKLVKIDGVHFVKLEQPE